MSLISYEKHFGGYNEPDVYVRRIGGTTIRQIEIGMMPKQARRNMLAGGTLSVYLSGKSSYAESGEATLSVHH